jgi:hypothetical protein
MIAILACAVVVAFVAGWLLWRRACTDQDPVALRRIAETEIELHRVRRVLELTELEHTLRRDERRLRREVVRDLARLEHGPTTTPPRTRRTASRWSDRARDTA